MATSNANTASKKSKRSKLTEEERKLALSVATATPAGLYALFGAALLLLAGLSAAMVRR